MQKSVDAAAASQSDLLRLLSSCAACLVVAEAEDMEERQAPMDGLVRDAARRGAAASMQPSRSLRPCGDSLVHEC